MKFNKQIAVILVLSSLLISAIGAAIFLYYEGETVKKANAAQLTVFVAKNDIKKNTLIQESDVNKAVVAKRYLLTKPLLEKEIIGKFAKENIYKNEMFRKEKLTSEIGEVEVKTLPFKYNSYNADYKLFHNPNYSLVKGDIINIVSVYPRSKDRNNLNYNVRYVAKQVKVVGFLEEGKVVNNAFRHVKKLVQPKKKDKKTTKPTYEMVKVFANELVLDISDKTILSMTDDYNKGKQLWMVKTNQIKEVPKKAPVKIELAVKKASAKTKKVERIYPYKMYVPKNLSHTKTAVIEYEDTTIPQVSKNAVIKTDLQTQCSSEKKLLIGISRKVYVRSVASLNGKIKRIIYRNYLIPYKSKFNDYWYETCDGKFVHKNEAMEIDYVKAQGLLNANKNTKK